LTEPRGLLTGTLNPNFFPEGFIGAPIFIFVHTRLTMSAHRDEGFHLLHTGDWDDDFKYLYHVIVPRIRAYLTRASLEIRKSWINNSRVAREQILGLFLPKRQRCFDWKRVPTEFQTQAPQFANPPTLPVAITAFISRLDRAKE
jgi:mannosyl-oligosaccharide glucosidase